MSYLNEIYPLGSIPTIRLRPQRLAPCCTPSRADARITQGTTRSIKCARTRKPLAPRAKSASRACFNFNDLDCTDSLSNSLENKRLSQSYKIQHCRAWSFLQLISTSGSVRFSNDSLYNAFSSQRSASIQTMTTRVRPHYRIIRLRLLFGGYEKMTATS